MELNELTDDIKTVSTEVSKFDAIAAGIAELNKAHPKDVACDCTTTAGMKQAVAGRAAWRAPRLAVEAARKAAKAPVLDLGRKVDAFAKDLTAQLLEGESNYDEQIKAEEARREEEKAAKAEAERQRVQAHHDRISFDIRGTVAGVIGRNSDDVSRVLADIEGLTIDDSFEEFKALAETAKAETIAKLRDILGATIEAEHEAARIKAEQDAEAARLNAEREELARLRAEQAERDRAAAEARAKEERVERSQLEAEQAAARAERKRLDDEAAERRRAADEAAASERAEADRRAREAREDEERRLQAERAELRHQEEAAAAQRRAAEEADEAERRRVAAEMAARAEAARAADARLRNAAQKLLNALVLAVPFVTDDAIAEKCREAIEEATGAEAVPA